MSIRSVVENQTRTDEVLYKKEDQVANNCVWYGRAVNFQSPDDMSVWQIKQISYEGGIVVTRFARSGSYNCKWSNRASYFTPIPAGPGFPTETTSAETPDLVLTTPTIVALTTPTANVEYSYAFPPLTKYFSLTLRQGGPLKIAYSPGAIAAGGYKTISPGEEYPRETIKATSLTLYYASTKTNTIIELESWV